MTTIYRHRCIHCLDQYTYQASGEGCGAHENDARYCPNCKRVILSALARVPKVIKKFMQIVNDDNECKMAIAERDRQKDHPPQILGMPVWQILPGLYNIRTGAHQHVNVVTLNRIEYNISEWSDGHESIKVEKVMERDLRTGAVHPWMNLP
jgi:hypothetical protein